MATAKRLKGALPRDHREIVRLLALCALVGIVAGLGAIAFYYMLEYAEIVFLGGVAGYHIPLVGYEQAVIRPPVVESPPAHRWVLLFLPAVGGLLSGFLVFSLAPEAEGHGTDAAIEAYHFKTGEVRARVPIVKMLASAFTIGSGGSGGREGPIAQIGAGFGSVLAKMLHLPVNERRTMMAAGMGAGIGAIFHAPLAGAIFAAEVMYKELDIEHEILVPSFIASIVAYVVFGFAFGFRPLFITPNYVFDHAAVLLPFTLLAIVCAGGAALYVTAFYGVRKLLLHRLRVPNHIKPAIGGLLVGVIGFFLPDVLGTGYGVVQSVFYGEEMPARWGVNMLASWGWFEAIFPLGTKPVIIAILFLVTIAVGKIATTAMAIGSGGSGGVFGPAIVIGGSLGAATGMLCQHIFPGMHVQAGAFALVGMAGFFAAAANTPISTIIMVSEMTGNYNLLLPAMLVCVLAYLLCRRFNLYHEQLSSHFAAPSQFANMADAVLRQLTVDQAISPKQGRPLVVVLHDADFHEVMDRFIQSPQACLPVVDEKGSLSGVIDARDIRRVMRLPGLDSIITAADLEGPATTLTRSDTLSTAIDRMVGGQADELVVVDEHGPLQIVGTISRGDIVGAYDRHLIRGTM